MEQQNGRETRRYQTQPRKEERKNKKRKRKKKKKKGVRARPLSDPTPPFQTYSGWWWEAHLADVKEAPRRGGMIRGRFKCFTKRPRKFSTVRRSGVRGERADGRPEEHLKLFSLPPSLPSRFWPLPPPLPSSIGEWYRSLYSVQ